MRIKIAEHMLLSKRTSAHVTTVHRVDMTKVARLRERHKAAVQADYGFSLTYLPFIARASVAALRQYPAAERLARRQQHRLSQRNQHRNRGGAGERPDRAGDPPADEKNVLGLQRAIVDLAARARSRQLKPDEVTGGTRTGGCTGNGFASG